MKKRMFVLLLSALLLLGGLPLPAAAEESVTGIASREELEAIRLNPSGSYRLTADIDLDGAPWTPIPFSGTLDGDGHTLYNLRVDSTGEETVTTFDGNRKEYETVFGALFSTVTDATVKNLNLVNATVAVSTDRNCFLAPLAGYALRSSFEACSVSSRVALTLSGTNEGVGGLIGFADGCIVEGCSVDCVLTFTDTNEAIDCEEFMGGIIACGSGRVNDCAVKLRGFAEIYGYAHGGGVFGMHKLRRGLDFFPKLSRTTVDAEISFFEVSPVKRSYCDPLIGEDSGGYCTLSKNTVSHFDSFASRSPVRLRPEACESPVYEAVITEPTCSSWGFTTYTCSVCGYTYTDFYTPPAHRYDAVETPPTCTEAGETTYTCVYCGDSYSDPIPPAGHTPGEWTTVREAAIGVAGEEQQTCVQCGAVLQTRPIPAREAPPVILAESVSLLPIELMLTVGESAELNASVLPESCWDPGVVFASEDPAIASVSETGTVAAHAPGTARIHCVSAGGNAEAVCNVTVRYSVGQWIVHYILFGWLWDR